MWTNKSRGGTAPRDFNQSCLGAILSIDLLDKWSYEAYFLLLCGITSVYLYTFLGLILRNWLSQLTRASQIHKDQCILYLRQHYVHNMSASLYPLGSHIALLVYKVLSACSLWCSKVTKPWRLSRGLYWSYRTSCSIRTQTPGPSPWATPGEHTGQHCLSSTSTDRTWSALLHETLSWLTWIGCNISLKCPWIQPPYGFRIDGWVLFCCSVSVI